MGHFVYFHYVSYLFICFLVLNQAVLAIAIKMPGCTIGCYKTKPHLGGAEYQKLEAERHIPPIGNPDIAGRGVRNQYAKYI